MKPKTSTQRLTTARKSRPLCWGREKPHIFKHEGRYRLSLEPDTSVNMLMTGPRLSREERQLVQDRWHAAAGWVWEMNGCEP